VRVKEVEELALGDQNSVHELLHLRVTGFQIGEYLTQK
jgi:hypothetical protein